MFNNLKNPVQLGTYMAVLLLDFLPYSLKHFHLTHLIFACFAFVLIAHSLYVGAEWW